jgi:hypothetical protein
MIQTLPIAALCVRALLVTKKINWNIRCAVFVNTSHYYFTEFIN